ncbi:MAG: hypothetical protein HY696_02045 [Deltaproteobacteria bacterium]|nr:hypothetical protein [Deltaproteobacteria bacterium]
MPLRPVPRAARYLPATADLRRVRLPLGTIAVPLPNGWIYVSRGWPVAAHGLRTDAALAMHISDPSQGRTSELRNSEPPTPHALRFADSPHGRPVPARNAPPPDDAAAHEGSHSASRGDRLPPISPPVLAALRGLAWDHIQDGWQRPFDAALATVGYPTGRKDITTAWQRGRRDLATEQTVSIVNALGARTYEPHASLDTSLAYAALLRDWSREWTRRLPAGMADTTIRRTFPHSRMHDFLTHALQRLQEIAATQPERRTDFPFLFRVRAVLAVAATVVAADCLPGIADTTVVTHQHTYRPAETDTLLLHYRWCLEIGAYDWARAIATDIDRAAPRPDPSGDFSLLARLCEELTNTEWGATFAEPLTAAEFQRGRRLLAALLPHTTQDANHALRELIALATDTPLERPS